MQRRQILKVSNGVVLAEHALMDGNQVAARAYTVKSQRTPQVPNFSTFGEADVYFDEELLRVLNPKVV
jgi:hypothetical protein